MLVNVVCTDCGHVFDLARSSEGKRLKAAFCEECWASRIIEEVTARD